jgi:hypothetical protein
MAGTAGSEVTGAGSVTAVPIDPPSAEVSPSPEPPVAEMMPTPPASTSAPASISRAVRGGMPRTGRDRPVLRMTIPLRPAAATSAVEVELHQESDAVPELSR